MEERIIKSQVENWPDWSTERLILPNAKISAIWLIDNGYSDHPLVKKAFYFRELAGIEENNQTKEKINEEIEIIKISLKLRKEK